MTTVVVVRKGDEVAMAADTLVTFGDTCLNAPDFESNQKIFAFETEQGITYIGMVGTVAHFPALNKAINSLDLKERKFGNKQEVFETFLKLHPILKNDLFLQTKEEDSDPYESSQFTVMIANGTGIYGVYSYREVFEFKSFWSVGSGRNFALGAMHALYKRVKSAREIARLGVEAGCIFDKNSAPPIEVVSVKLQVTSNES